MKKIQLMIGAAALLTGFSACSNSNEEAKQDTVVLTQYVDSVEMATPVYTTANWSDIDNGYEVRVSKVEKNMPALSAEDKAKAEASKAKYAALKAKYEMEIKSKEAADKMAASPDYRLVLRNGLFGEGKVGTDMSFAFVTADNIKDVYERFVSTVDDNKNNYSREDWDEIKVLYEALDNRKNKVEKDLATRDNLRIAALKIKFAAIKSVKRPGAKVEENIKSKQ